MQITLTVTEGPHAGRVFTFAGHQTFVVGRSKKAHFQLPSKDKYFSRTHFFIEVNPPFIRLTDMGSTNHTYVNGKQVSQVDLKNGDQIKAGRTILQVSVLDTATDPAMDIPFPPQPGTRVGIPTPLTLPVTPTPFPSPPPPPPRAVEEIPFAEVISVPVQSTPFPVPPPPPSIPPRPSAPFAPSLPVTTPQICRICGQQAAMPTASQPDVIPFLCRSCINESRAIPQTMGGYHLIRELGKGAMGVVHLALKLDDASAVALKTVIPAVAANPRQLERFLREANILRDLQHPNIVRFREMGERNGVLFFAMDYVRGIDAARMLKQHGPFAIPRAIRLGCQMLEALGYAHKQRFVHRDVKSSNILIANEGGREIVKVADFGLARVYQASHMSGLTMSGDIGGTMPFMPPEQILDFRDAKPTADQYSATATIYHLLTGAYVHNLPQEFHGQIKVILEEPPIPITQRRPDIPPGLAQIIHKGIAHEPEDRYPSILDLREALRPYEIG